MQEIKREMELISVIVTVYNMEKCLNACVSSILMQTYPDFEVLLVDDGSNDDSLVLCSSFAAQDPRVKVIHQENMGLSGARNTGLRHAQGQYVTFIDADDTVEPDYLKILYETMRRYNVRLSACNHGIVRGQGKALPRFSCKKETVVLDAEEAARNVLYQQLPDVSCWGKLYEITLFDGLEYPIGRIYEDTYLFADILLRAGHIAFANAMLYNYIQRSDSLSHGTYTQIRVQYMEAVDRMTELFETAFPQLAQACRCRRAYAAMSVRRYFVGCDASLYEKRSALEKLIRGYAKDVLLSLHTPMRDKLAMAALMIHPRVYDLMWTAYARCRG